MLDIYGVFHIEMSIVAVNLSESLSLKISVKQIPSVPFVQILHLIEIFIVIVSYVLDIQIADVNMYDFTL